MYLKLSYFFIEKVMKVIKCLLLSLKEIFIVLFIQYFILIISIILFNGYENIYIGNINKDEKKLIIPKIKMLDYYLKLSYKYDVITKRKYEVVSNYLLELTKMIIGWINEENK